MDTPASVQQHTLEMSVRQRSTFVGGTDVEMVAHVTWMDVGIAVCVLPVMRVTNARLTLMIAMETPA